MFEVFHILVLFYVVFSEQYASGTWKCSWNINISPPVEGNDQQDEISMFHIHNSPIISSLLFFFVFFSGQHLLVNIFMNEH